MMSGHGFALGPIVKPGRKGYNEPFFASNKGGLALDHAGLLVHQGRKGYN